MTEKELFNDLMIAIDEEDIKYLIRNKERYKPILAALNRLEILERELKKQDKELVELTKVLKIIVEKQVDIPELLRADNVVEYNSKHWSESLDLSKSEFDFLKEYLK